MKYPERFGPFVPRAIFLTDEGTGLNSAFGIMILSPTVKSLLLMLLYPAISSASLLNFLAIDSIVSPFLISYCIPEIGKITKLIKETVEEKTLYEFAHNLIDTSVGGIIEKLNLRQPIYSQTSAYGHFGKPELPWEKVISQ